MVRQHLLLLAMVLIRFSEIGLWKKIEKEEIKFTKIVIEKFKELILKIHRAIVKDTLVLIIPEDF